MSIPRSVWVLLTVGLLAASQSGNLIRLGEAHPVAIAAWRLLLASLLLLPMAGSRMRQLAKLSAKERWLLVVAGVALATHFFAWIAAVQMTTVANAAIVFSINPVITATAAWVFFRERFSKRLVASVCLGLAGVIAITGGDFELQPENLPGDGMALLCSFLFTTYFLLSKRLRPKLDTRVYVCTLYGVAALFSFGVLMAMGLPLVNYTSQTWLCFALMALVPTLLGHTSFNYAVRYVDAGRISVLILTEPMLAAIVARFAWGEEFTASGLVGYGLIILSVVVLLWRGLRLPARRSTAGLS